MSHIGERQLTHDAKQALKKDMVNYMHLNNYQVMSLPTYQSFIKEIKEHLRYNIKASKELLETKESYKVRVNKKELKLLENYVRKHQERVQK